MSTVLHVQFNGADAATTYTAETGQTCTFVGDAELDTAQKKFGLSSLYLVDGSDAVRVPDNATWDLGAGDWTLHTYVRYSTLSEAHLAGHSDGWTNDLQSWGRHVTTNKLFMYGRKANAFEWSYIMTNNWSAVAVDTWYHLAFVRSGNNAYIFINGVSQPLTTNTAFDAGNDVTVGQAFQIGAAAQETDTENTQGWIDEFVLDKGTALWTSNFTPPSPMSYAHYKCNDDAASTTVTDDGTGSNNGTANVNTSNYSTTGKINEGFDIDAASSEYINVDGLYADIVNDTIGSLSVWLKADSTSGERRFFTMADSDGSDGYVNFRQLNTGMGLYIKETGANSSSWQALSTITTSWQHWVFVQDGTALKIYLDGVSQALTTDFNGTGADSRWFSAVSADVDNGYISSLFYNTGSAASPYDGIIDDFRYYKNTALTQQDVTNLYNAGSGTETDPAPYVSSWSGYTQSIIIT